MTEEEIAQYINGPVLPDPSVFVDRVSPRHGLTVNVPANLPEIAVDNEVSFQSGMPSDYMYGSARFDGDDDFLDGFGLTGGVGTPKDFIKGVAKSAGDLTAGFLGQTLFQLGESIEEGEGVQDRFRALVEGDIKSLLTMAINPVESISTLLEDIGEVTGTKQAMAQRFQILGQRLIDRNDAWIARHGLAFTDAGEPTLLHAIGSGTTSLAGALGLAFVTKSPTATALLFGQIQGSDTYIEAREQGLDINDSQFYSGISLVTEAALEKFGLDIILRGTGGGFYKNVAKGFLTEGTQEAMQTSAEMAIEEMGGFSNLTSEQKIQGIKQAALIGALLGGPAGGVFGGGVPKQTLEDILVRELEDMDITEVSLQNDIDSGRPTIKLTSQMSKDQREIIEKLNKFLAGEEIEWDTKDSRDRAVMRAVRSIKNSRIQAGQELIAGQGRLLQERRSGIVSKLRDIERRGEDLVKRLLEKFPDEERSIETQERVEEIVDMIAEIQQSGGNAFEDNALMDLIDEYGYSEMMDDIRQDAEFRDVIETDEGFIRIQGQAEGLREQLAAIDRQIDEIRELDPEGEVFEATGRQLQLRDDIFRKLNMLAEDTLDIGVEAGKKQARKGADFFRSQFNKAIDSLPVKAKDRFRRRLRYIDDRPETFQRQMDKLATDAIVQVDREMRKSAKEKVKSVLSKGVKAKVHADIKDSLIRMKKMKKGKLKKFTAETSNDGLIDLMTDMEVRYARLLQDKSASTLEWQLFGEDLAQIIKTGKTVWQQYQERITGRQKDMINEVVSSKAKSGPVVSRLNRITGAAGMNTIVWTFDTIIDMAGLRNTVFGRWIKADMAFRSNRNAFNDKIKRLVAETMPNGYRSNLKEITIKSGSGVKQTLTYGQAIQLWMYSRSREVRQSMMDGDGMAYTEDNFNEIESFIGKQGTDFAQGLFDIYEESGIRMNDEHRKVFGVSLDLRENYSPVTREGAEGQDVLAVGYNSAQLFHEPSSFKKFTNSKNNIIIDDALQVAYRHMNSTEWWLAYHNVYRDSKALLKNNDVREKIIQRMGENNLKALENHVSKMEHYSGEWNIMSGGTIDKFRRNFTRSVLGANPQIGIKQLSSALASLSTVPAADYAKAQAEFWNPVMMPKILKKLSEHESSRRGKNFDPEIAEMIIENPGKWLGKKGMTRFIDFSLMPVRMGDMLGFSASVYAEYRYLKKIGVPDKQALNRAMENGERSQQSVLPSQMTILQKEGHPLVRLITMFTSSPVALMNMEMKAVQAYRDGRIDKRDMMRRIAIYHSFIPMLFGFIATAFDTEPEEVVYNGMFGSWGSTPLYGSSLTHIGGMITGSDVFQKEELAPDLIFETTRENTKALNMVWRDFIKDDESFTMEEYYQAITDAITSDIEILTGMPASNIVDMLEGIKGLVGEDDKWDFFFKSLGFSDYIIEQDSDGGATVNFTI